MRRIKTMTVVPSIAYIVVDGEGYACAPFEIADVQGQNRAVPSHMVIELRWWDEFGRGQVDGEGMVGGRMMHFAEPFTDRAVIEPYVAIWLRARAIAKREALEAATRHRAHHVARVKELTALIAALGEELDRAKADVAAARPEQRPIVQGHLDRLMRLHANASAELASVKTIADDDATIAAATEAADRADAEAKAA